MKVRDLPKALRPYAFHGVLFSEVEAGKTNITADCPFCSRLGKFGVHVEKGTAHCWGCVSDSPKGGWNHETFLRSLHTVAVKGTTEDELRSLADDRGLLSTDTLRAWGVAKPHILRSDWLVPGYGVGEDGKVKQLYRYISPREGEKRRLFATPEISHCLLGLPLFNPRCKEIWLCEGVWDAMALWEVLGRARVTGEKDDGPLTLSNREGSLLSSISVLAVPGCGVFNPTWTTLFSGKRVSVLYDNDHPRESPGAPGGVTPPVAAVQLRRVTSILRTGTRPPLSVRCLSWHRLPDGHDPSLPGGHDVRDILKGSGDTYRERLVGLAKIRSMLGDVPYEAQRGRSSSDDSAGERGPAHRQADGPEPLALEPCTSWRTLVTAWRAAMTWTEGLDRALSVMLASIISTKSVGDQLWVKIMGPAACGKSTLCEALSVNREHIVAKSTIRGFHSGYRTPGGGGDDNSLVAQLYDKTLVTKDGDTLLQSPNVDQILAEARDLYDSTSRTHYRHGLSRDYQGVRMTWILCGTASLRSLDSSELGERFLDCVIMDRIDDETEDPILWRVARRAHRNMSLTSNGRIDGQHDPALVKAMRLTGGYIDYLKKGAAEMLAGVEAGEEALQKCINFGKFVAYMRARPSRKQDETTERELASRLVSQHVRLATCLAAVLNRRELDAEVLRRVARVTLDTSRGKVMDLCQNLYNVGEVGAELGTLALWAGDADENQRKLLRFLKKLNVVEAFKPMVGGRVSGTLRWRLTNKLTSLLSLVLPYANNEEDRGNEKG